MIFIYNNAHGEIDFHYILLNDKIFHCVKKQNIYNGLFYITFLTIDDPLPRIYVKSYPDWL